MRYHRNFSFSRRLAPIGMLGLLLAACGGGDGGGGTPSSVSTTVGGVAATGAPIAGGNIVLHCQNSWNEGTTTDSNGQWSLVVPTANLPCAVKASVSGGGESYFSFTTGSGSSIVTNITPLTSLALAKAGIVPDDTWFNALNNAGLQALSGNLATAITSLAAALTAQSYTLPANFNPLASVFTATAGDDYDDLLEQLKAAVAAAGTDFSTVLANFSAGATLPAAVEGSGTPSSGGATTASGSLTTDNALSPDFTPKSDGFSIEVDYESIKYSFSTTRQVGNVSYQHNISIETDIRGNITDLTYLDGSRLGLTTSIVCGINHGKPCSGITLTPAPATKSVTLTFANAVLAVRNGVTLGADTLFNGSLTGVMPSAAAISISDLPRSTTGTPSLNGTNEPILSTGMGVSSTSISNGTYTVTTLTMLTANGMFTLTRNRTALTSGSTTETSSLLYQRAGVSGANSIYSCSGTCTGMTLSESGGVLSIQFQDAVLDNYGDQPALTLNGTLSIGNTQGTLTSSAEGSFTPVSSSISATDGVLDYSFSSLGTVSGTAISMVTVSVRGNVLTGVSVSTAVGGKLYTCTEQGVAILGWPACGGSVTISSDRRTLTLTGVSLNTGSYGGNQALTVSGSLTNRGL